MQRRHSSLVLWCTRAFAADASTGAPAAAAAAAATPAVLSLGAGGRCALHSDAGGGAGPPHDGAPATSHWDERQYLDEEHLAQEQEEQQQQQQAAQVVDKQQVLREVLRKTHAAEAAMAQVLAGQQLVLRGRPDAAWFAAQERQALAAVQQLLPGHRVRPSALLAALQAAGLAAGAAAALSPPAARDAAIAALQESLTDLYNDQLRVLREAGLSDEAADVRAVLLRLRDLQRAAEGASPPPGLLAVQQAFSTGSLRDLGLTGVVGTALKAAADAAIAATAKL